MTSDFVSTEWLQDHLHDPAVRIVDIRGRVLPPSEPKPHYYSHHDDYMRAHIPGAVFINWNFDLTDPADSRRGRLSPPDLYERLMQRLGISDSTHVIAYDDAGGMFAARLWWSMNYYGHTQVSVLAGGWNAWIAENRPTDADAPAYLPGNFTARLRPSLFRSGDQVAAHNGILIDVRTPGEFAGTSSRAARGGHIPGAINLPRSDLLDSTTGEMLPPDALRLRFADAGIRLDAPDQDVVFYCNGGVSASFGLLALRTAGFEGGAVYDGSWKEWGNDPERPIA
jgi:thiosulfate/3-mercaptopyruvate sulfurtransferase